MSGYKSRFFIAVILVMLLSESFFGQSRVRYDNKQIFLSGANVAWVNFAADIGKGTTNINAFKQIFSDVHKNGGNCMRLWLHTAASNSPEFDSRGMVTGPGRYTISDLRSILDEAQKNKIGLMLCLWSFDMLRISFGKTVTDRGYLMLTDTAYTNAYVRNSLIPMVNEVKGHPAILAWEIFNEPEGMSNEYGWEMTYHVPMSNIQRFINLTVGAIHKSDSTALVTNGSWCLKAQSDVIASANEVNRAAEITNNLTSNQKEKIEEAFNKKYGYKISAEKIIENYYGSAAADMNYYRDDRLISAGGNIKGTLDFYTVHYYNWANIPYSPFHFPAAHWGLNKPLAIAEFFIEDTFGIPALALYKNLIDNGYAGALAWAWYGNPETQALVRASTNFLFRYNNEDVDLDPHTGKLFYFTASKTVIEKGDSVVLYWGASKGSTVKLNGVEVNYIDSLTVTPKVTTEYKMVTSGEVTDTMTITIMIQPSGKILSFSAYPAKIAMGEKTTLSWKSTNGSSLKLNGSSVSQEGEKEFTINGDSKFVLSASGEITDTAVINLNLLPAEFINRCLNAKVYVSSSEKGVNENPLNMVDGTLATKWSSAYADQQWFLIDLARQHVINKLVLRWDVNYAKKYRVGISDDSLNWSIAVVNFASPGGTEVIDNLTEKGRYIKVMLDQRATKLGSALYEFEAYGKQSGITSINKNETSVPGQFALSQNFPNPFNPVTKISFTVPYKAKTLIKIFDLLGNEVRELLNEEKNTGRYDLTFNAAELASGIYFCRLVAGGYSHTIKMIYLK